MSSLTYNLGSVLLAVFCLTAAAPTWAQTLRICGDSTAASYAIDDSRGQQGWGFHIGSYLDIPVDNRALGGRSTRRFINEGHWDALIGNSTAGDYVLVEMGKNDDGKITAKDRAVLPGIGNENVTVDLTLSEGTEIVHTFGWYLRKMIADVRAVNAVPILSGMTPRNYWDSSSAMQSEWPFADYAQQVAEQEGVALSSVLVWNHWLDI
ncbi:unnamed protein product [Discula destructiva]